MGVMALVAPVVEDVVRTGLVALAKTPRSFVNARFLCKIWKFYMAVWAQNVKMTNLGVVPVESARVRNQDF